MNAETGRAFLAEARRHLREDYLPKIERCLERLTDEQVWWRASERSNSVGNLLLHLEGNLRQWVVSGAGGALAICAWISSIGSSDANGNWPVSSS